jgi:hypothetical protein
MKRRIALLLVGGMVAAGAILSPPVEHLAQAGSGGGTSASVSGTTLTITVNFDLCCTTNAAERTIYGPLIQDEVRAAENLWNQALAKLLAKGCFRIAVVFSEHLLDKPNWEGGYHEISIDFIHPGRPYSNDLTPGITHNDDTAWVYNNTTTGSFYESSMDIGTWAHEIGHLMGLGDDYGIDHALGGHGGSLPLPGRGGTMMENHGVIDQNLADRLADIATKAGVKLPSCWKGTITSTSDRHYFDGGANYMCSDAWTGTLSFIVVGQGTVAGSGALNLQGTAVCQAPGAAGGTHGLPPEVQTLNFSVGGERTTTGFDLQFNITSIFPPQPGSIDVAGIESLLSTSACPHLPGPKLSIPFDHPNHATGSPVLNIKLVQGCPKSPTELQIDLFSSTSTIVLNGP